MTIVTIEKKAPQPLCIVEICDNEGRGFKTLARPWVIHYPAKGTKAGNRMAKKTFAVNFMDEYILIACTRCSKKDQYSRKIGLAVAVGRLDKLQNNYLVHGAGDLVYHEKNPFARAISYSQLNNRVFETCSIPAEVESYIRDIYTRFRKEAMITGDR